MTLLAKSTLSAAAAAIAAAALLTTVAIPAQAGYQGAPTTTVKPGVIKKPTASKFHITTLGCVNSSGDVVAYPVVINTTGKTLAIGKKIYWQAKMAGGSIVKGAHKLTKNLYAGQSRRMPTMLNWQFTCTAVVFV